MQCSRCRRDVAVDSRHCPSCGAPIDDVLTTIHVAERPPSTEPIDQARFIPGTMLTARYRIVSLIGRGGMGEVYRADDLKLGQPVALKFLPGSFANDPARLARFHQEVRVARQVSHPNVCRVYDIGEADGQAFLSMEYVDGEDLASLLRRIGRLPADKALQVARQLCAGLAAAHDRGVLHRDLKPANVLLDGRGHVRISDFGLAVFADERREPHVIAGTPAYMAPEQLDGRGATIRSDVYALGLILYEIFTGRVALAHNFPPADRRSADSSQLTRPSTITPDIDPIVERVILRCLEADPAQRPGSALNVAAALPGGDPLAAALAAGETPSPDMVAAAGEVGALSPAASVTYLAVTLIALLAMAVLSPRLMLLSVAGVDKEPAVLVERARTIAKNLGYENRPVDEAYGYEADLDYLRYVTMHDRSPSRWDALKTSRPTGVTFWYRQSRSPMKSMTFNVYGSGRVLPGDQSETQPGMLSMRIDSSGRLVRLFAEPGPADAARTETSTPDWARVFAESALPMDRFSGTSPLRQPTNPAETRAAWESNTPDRSDMAVRVEAAAANGRVVLFDASPAITRVDQREEANAWAPVDRYTPASDLISTLVWVGAALLARRNVRQGRGDRRGAFRLSVSFGVIFLLANTIGAHHPGDVFSEIELMQMLFALALYFGVQAWLIYMAIEPHLRRIWPEVLIGWSRVLTGRFRDPRVGRDVLIGACAATVVTLIGQVTSLASRWAGLPGPLLGFLIPNMPPGQLVVNARSGLEFVILDLWFATLILLVNATILVLFKILLRARTAAALALFAMFASFTIVSFLPPNIRDAQFVPFYLGVIVSSAGAVVLLVRFGALCALAFQWVFLLFFATPVTFDWSAPYAESSWLIVATVLALTIYGFRTTLAGRPIAVTRFAPQP